MCKLKQNPGYEDFLFYKLHSRVTQGLECNADNVEAVGSNPTTTTERKRNNGTIKKHSIR